MVNKGALLVVNDVKILNLENYVELLSCGDIREEYNLRLLQLHIDVFGYLLLQRFKDCVLLTVSNKLLLKL